MFYVALRCSCGNGGYAAFPLRETRGIELTRAWGQEGFYFAWNGSKAIDVGLPLVGFLQSCLR